MPKRYDHPVRFPSIPFVVLDTETTGFVPRVHRIIEFASVRVEGGTIVEEYEQLFSIPGEIPPQVQVLTRIKPPHVKNQPPIAERHEEILSKLPTECVLVGQNLGYDLSMLKGEGMDLTDRPWVDTSLLASLVFPELKSYSLQYLSTALKLNHEPAHRAMGDVRATLELLCVICDRLCELPKEALDQAKIVMANSTPGYEQLFASLESTAKTMPTWLKRAVTTRTAEGGTDSLLTKPPRGTVALQEEHLHADATGALVQSLVHAKGSDHWIAVKNLESAIRKGQCPGGATAIYPSSFLLNPPAVATLTAQETFTPEEATLTLKIAWFHPRTRNDIALHGGERDVWNGKLACTDASDAYCEQFREKAAVRIVDHRQLLAFLSDPGHRAHGTLTEQSHIIIADASMLEDTATKAYGHFCSLDDLRAAAQGNDALMSLVDRAVLWAEKTRAGEDQHLIAKADLARPETKGLLEQMAQALGAEELPERTALLLRDLSALLTLTGLENDVRWIEVRPNGTAHLHGAPERVDMVLRSSLYEKFSTTLIVPDGSNGVLPEVLPSAQSTVENAPLALGTTSLPISFKEHTPLASVLRDPPSGRTIVLAGSKRMIEQFFVTHTEELEGRGITLICQGLSGGQGRMEAEFVAAKTPVLWLLTPWMYEGIELSENSVDHLVLENVPFDHPNHPVLARRKNHFKNAFEQYLLPRVEQRVFRILRTFCRHRTTAGDVTILDQRLHERGYGVRLMSYIESIAKGSETKPASAQPPAKKIRATGKEGQQSLF